jgi:hypothetical protein
MRCHPPQRSVDALRPFSVSSIPEVAKVSEDEAAEADIEHQVGAPGSGRTRELGSWGRGPGELVFRREDRTLLGAT